LKVKINKIIIDAKDVYEEILKHIESIASKGEREIVICFLDDSFEFKHIKPIVEKLTKLTGLKIHAEGSALTRPCIYVTSSPA